MSEDAAFRRARAAKIAKQFPILFEQIAAGEIHLTAVQMLGPHLTEENHLEVLARAKHRTKKEISRLVRTLDPLPAVPARIEPLGPAPKGLKVPSWDRFVSALCGPVRELPPGDRPKDWVDANVDAELASTCPEAADEPAPEAVNTTCPQEAKTSDPQEADDSSFGPQRYLVQFTASEEYVELLEQARDLLAHAIPNRSIEQVHLRAMRTLVAELKKRKLGATDAPRRPRPENKTQSTPARAQRGRYVTAAVRRAVWSRDGGRCTFVDSCGQRCRETSCLELHHREAYARGGPPTEVNLTLRCQAHNALAAEEDFGRDFMAHKRGSADAVAGTDPAPARRFGGQIAKRWKCSARGPRFFGQSSRPPKKKWSPMRAAIIEHSHADALDRVGELLDQLPKAAVLVHRDLVHPKKRLGRKGMAAEQVLRAMLISQMNGFPKYEPQADGKNDKSSRTRRRPFDKQKARRTRRRTPLLDLDLQSSDRRASCSPA